MKQFLLFVIIGGALLGIGGWLWWRTQPPVQPVVFENTTLTFESPEKGVAGTQSLPSMTREEESRQSLSTLPDGATESALPVAATEGGDTVMPSPASSTPTITVQDQLLTFGFRTPPAPRSVNTIVIHSSYNASGGDPYTVDKIIGQYEQYGVGAHYLIDRGGHIIRLVRESDIAYHAGESKMPDGRKNVNDFSLGIELIGTEESGYTDKQYDALNALVADIKTRSKINDIVGHSDIAPTRKTDPWKFDWKKLK